MEQESEVCRLLSKSKESFVLAVELYNRPSMKYHAESCAIFLCNAWELMLKAYLVRERGENSIYYPNSKNTLALIDCLKSIYTNDKDPVRVNMKEVIEFRNTSTHYIIDEYDIFYGPFLQAAVTNYADKLMDLHGESVSELMPENHLALSVKRGVVNPDVVRARYSPDVAEHLFRLQRSTATAAGEQGDSKIAAIYETNFRIVKKARDADLNVSIEPNAELGMTIVKDIRDSNSYYPFTAKGCIGQVNARLRRRKVTFQYRQEQQNNFNMFHFNLFVKFFSMKGDDQFSHDRKASNEKNSSWTYSQRAVDFISDELEKNPETCIDALKEKLGK